MKPVSQESQKLRYKQFTSNENVVPTSSACFSVTVKMDLLDQAAHMLRHVEMLKLYTLENLYRVHGLPKNDLASRNLFTCCNKNTEVNLTVS